MTYGVPYELFWHLNPAKLKPFRLAYEHKLDADNHNAWLNGMYVQAAIGAAMSKSAKYPKAPFGSKDEARETTMESAEIAAKKFDAWTKIFNERFENKGENEYG